MDKHDIQFKNCCNKAKYRNVIRRHYKKLTDRIDNFNAMYNEDYILTVTKQKDLTKQTETSKEHE